MPTYDYKCLDCSDRFSKLVPLKDKDNVKCPKCGGTTQQLFTGFLYSKPSGGGNATLASSSCTKTSCGSCKGC